MKKGATLGANATILCGHVLGQFCFIGAAAVVTKDVLDHAVVVGNPAKQVGWVCTCGVRLGEGLECSSCARTYRQLPSGLKPEKNVTSIVHG
ncbi:MAG: hypothetical protein HY584_03255 [Candidatus Omnitrophica bacterium]|nr:hypothetical protein [Candidatus Omnitrophota bacterium]